MPVLRCDAGPDGLSLDRAALKRALASLPSAAPIVILVHGYKFSPFVPHADPHTHILAVSPRVRSWKAVSWPLGLGFGAGDMAEGLCIAFGWHARGSIWQAWDRAQEAGDALAAMVQRVAQLAGRRVDLIAHSLGARVCLRALARVPGAPVGRIILLNAAEFQGAAARATETEAGQGAEVINIVSRENDLFDALIERLVAAPDPGARVLGAGLDRRNWLDIQIDAGRVLRGFARLGATVPEARNRPCHWSCYARPGLLPFYGRLLREREHLSLELLRRSLAYARDPRWAGLRAGLPALRIAPLPKGQTGGMRLTSAPGERCIDAASPACVDAGARPA